MERINHIYTGAVWHNDTDDDDIVIYITDDEIVHGFSNKFDFKKNSKLLALAHLVKLGYHYVEFEHDKNKQNR